MPDDYTADLQTTGRLGMGGSMTGEIETAGDRDWFAVELVAGRTYVIDLEGSPTGDGTLANPYLRGIHDSRGVLIAGTTDDDGGTGRNSQLTFTAKKSGTYYVAAGAHWAETGSYTLRVADETPVADDFTDTTGTAGTVAVGGSATGRIGAARDVDWFALDVVAGRTYVIDLEGSATDAGTLVDPQLRGLFDADGNRLPVTTREKDGGEGLNSRMTWTATEAGTVYVAARGHRDGTGTYTVRVTDADAAPRGDGSGTGTDKEPVVRNDDYTNDTNTTGMVTVGGSVRGEIETVGDRDWFAVELVEDTYYEILMNTTATSSGDPIVNPKAARVFDPDVNRITDTWKFDDIVAGNFGSRLIFQATATGTHYVEAASENNTTGGYRLRVAAIDWVSVNGPVTGIVTSVLEHDIIAVELVENTIYQFYLGWVEGGETDFDPYLFGIHDSRGNLIPDTGNDNFNDMPLSDSLVVYQATATGIHYVRVGGADGSGLPGHYELSVTELGTDDFADDTGTTGVVAADGSTTGRIDSAADRDWFAVELVQGWTYRFDLEGSDAGSGALRAALKDPLKDPFLDGIYDADSNLIAGTSDNDGGRGLNSQVTFTASATGTYYVAAAGNENMMGAYELSVTVLDAITADTGTAGAVAVDGSTRSRIAFAGDRDWFAVELEAGTTYVFDLEGQRTRRGTLIDPSLDGIYDGDGDLVPGTKDEDGGVAINSRAYLTPETGGTYYVAAAGNGNMTGSYRLTVREYTDDTISADTGTDGEVAVGGSTRSRIDYPHEQDWFAVDLVAGTAYTIDLEGYFTGAGGLFDPYLRGVYDGHGVLIPDTANNDGGEVLNSRVTFTASETGTHYVSAGADHGNRGTYRLSVEEVAEDDFAADTGTTGRVAVGGSATGVNEGGHDRDWFAVTLRAGTTYRIDLKGSETPGAGTLHDPYLHGVYDEYGTLIQGTANDQGHAVYNSRVYFTALESGTYYVAAGADGNMKGSYTLSVADTRNYPDDFTADIDTTGVVTVGGSVEGDIEFLYDRDWFKVRLEAHTTYRLDLEGQDTGAGTLDDPYLYGVYNQYGNLIAGTEDGDGGEGLNSRTVFTTGDRIGAYYVAAGDQSGSAYREGTYTLSVEEVM